MMHRIFIIFYYPEDVCHTVTKHSTWISRMAGPLNFAPGKTIHGKPRPSAGTTACSGTPFQRHKALFRHT